MPWTLHWLYGSRKKKPWTSYGQADRGGGSTLTVSLTVGYLYFCLTTSSNWFSDCESLQVSGQKNTIEGCKSVHFHHACRQPAKHEPVSHAEASEKRAGGRREEANEAALQRLESRHPESGRTRLNARRELEDTESKKRKKSRKLTLGNSTFYHA